MGGGGSDSSNNWMRDIQLLQDWNHSISAAADAQQQQMGGIELSWLRNYGQSPAMKAAGVPSPFSTVSGGFQTPFLSAAGTRIGGAIPGGR